MEGPTGSWVRKLMPSYSEGKQMMETGNTLTEEDWKIEKNCVFYENYSLFFNQMSLINKEMRIPASIIFA